MALAMRKRSLFTVGLITISLITVTYAVSRLIILRGFIKVEDVLASRNIMRARDILFHEIAALDVKLSDWSA